MAEHCRMDGLSRTQEIRRVGLVSGDVQTRYSYDNASRLTGLAYSNLSGRQYGTLTYGYDADSQVNDVGGTLAATTEASRPTHPTARL
jgi:hypothetical protein